MDELVNKVNETISNLKGKNEFLKEQEIQYAHIKQQLLAYNSDDYTQSGEGTKGLVFGEIIISSKIFLNIGYDYYVEKSKEEVVSFVDNRLKVIRNAVEQFQLKLEEANQVLKDIEHTRALESGEKQSHQKQPERPEQQAVNEDGLPFMEIREELDDDGNVVDSKISRTDTTFLQNLDEAKALDDVQDTNIGSIQETGVNQKAMENGLQDSASVHLKKHLSRDTIDKKNGMKGTPDLTTEREKQLDQDEFDDFYDVLEEMGIIDKKEIYLNKKHNVIPRIEEIKEDHFDASFEQNLRTKLQKNPSDDTRKKEDEFDGRESTKNRSHLNQKAESIVGEIVEKDSPTIKDVELNDIRIKGNDLGLLDRKFDSEKPAIDPQDIYTFDDIVQQLDQTDDLEDGEVNETEIQFDFLAYDEGLHDSERKKEFSGVRRNGINSDNYEDEEDGDDDDDDDDDYYYEHLPSLVPGAAQKSFMDQISKLRSERLANLKEGSNRDEENVRLKPILKKETSSKENSKGKKSVGFASELDIYEVENVKGETKKNTFNFPRFPFQQQYHDYQEYTDDDSAVSTDDFDSELFASMLGIKEADEIHDKYKDQVLEKESKPVQNKPKVSRFKQARKNKERGAESTHTAQKQTLLSVQDSAVQNSVSDADNDRTVSYEIVEKESVVGNIFEKGCAIPDTPVMGPAATRTEEENVTIHDSITGNATSRFGKEMNSLRKPKKKTVKPPVSVFSKTRDQKSVGESQLEEPEKPASAMNGVQIREVSEPVQDLVPGNGFEVPDNDETSDFKKPSVDFQRLGNDLDDMARAYLLGMYDGDIDDPGTVVEKLDDFKHYNEEAEVLEDEIQEFIQEDGNGEDEDLQTFNEEGDEPMVTDVIEHNVEQDFDEDNYDIGLQEHTLQEEVSVQYHKMRHQMIAAQNGVQKSLRELELEPIDEYGNPVKTSRFKSAKLKMDYK